MSNYRIDTRTIVPGLAVTLADGVLSVTIDRPESLNSLTKPVLAGMADAIEGAATDPRVKVVRLGGAGRGFSSGGAISVDDVWASGPPTDTVAEANRTVRAIVALPQPVVAVVQGPTVGCGVSLALACDLVLASDNAFFMLAHTNVGLMPDGGASALVQAAIGRIRAMHMALLPDRVPAAEALSWGLVSLSGRRLRCRGGQVDLTAVGRPSAGYRQDEERDQCGHAHRVGTHSPARIGWPGPPPAY